MPYIDVQNVSFYYDNNPVLEDVSYSVNPGEFVTLTGENGAAKSTLIKITLGILKPKSGKVIIARHDTQNRRLRIAYVPQQISSFNAGFPSTVHEFVRSGRYPRKGWFRKLNAHDEEHVEAALNAVGMWDFRHKKLENFPVDKSNVSSLLVHLLLTLMSLFWMNQLLGWTM